MYELLVEWRPWLVCLGCAAHGFNLVLNEIFSKSSLVRMAWRAVERILSGTCRLRYLYHLFPSSFTVFKSNPLWQEEVLKAQTGDDVVPLSILGFGKTRWNSRVECLERMVILVAPINLVLSKKVS